MRHRETPLHWAASNDDVVLIDALLDAGANIEHEGSSIDGGAPLSSAVGYGQWAAALRLFEVEADLLPRPEALSGPFWNACHGGQLATARYLLAHGADLNWTAPWSGQTPLDIAEQAGRSDVMAWLLAKGATRGTKSA